MPALCAGKQPIWGLAGSDGSPVWGLPKTPVVAIYHGGMATKNIIFEGILDLARLPGRRTPVGPFGDSPTALSGHEILPIRSIRTNEEKHHEQQEISEQSPQ